MDCKAIQVEYGIKRSAAEAVMRALTKVTIENVRRVYVYREDVERYFADRTAA